MSAEFHPNGYIEALIEKYGPTAAEVKEAIEFWGPDAGEFVVTDESLTAGLSSSTLGGRVFEEREERQI